MGGTHAPVANRPDTDLSVYTLEVRHVRSEFITITALGPDPDAVEARALQKQNIEEVYDVYEAKTLGNYS